MSTHNICFHREIRKILCGYPLLSVAMMFYSATKSLGGRLWHKELFFVFLMKFDHVTCFFLDIRR